MADTLKIEMETFAKLQPELERDHMGKWVVIHGEKLIKVFAEFEEAAADAVSKFGRGPFLIRQVGAPPVSLPASVMYRLVHA